MKKPPDLDGFFCGDYRTDDTDNTEFFERR